MSSPDPVHRIEAGLEQLRETAQRWERHAWKTQTWLRETGDALAKDTQDRAEESLRDARVRAESLRRELAERAEDAWDESRVSERWNQWRDQAVHGVRRGLQHVVDSLPVASQGEIDRVNRKITSLQRKLRKIEKANA